MRILLVSGSLPPLRCGVGDYTLSLAHALAAIPDAEVAILSSRGAALDPAARIQIFPVMNAWRLREMNAFWRTMRAWRPDILHIQYPTQGYGRGFLPTFIPLIAFIAGIRVVRTWHEIPNFLDIPAFIFEAIVPGPHVVVRPQFERRLHPILRFLLKNKSGKFIMNASSIPRSDSNRHERQIIRQRLLKEKSRLIVYFGFIYPFKGVEQLFEIANPETDRLVIAGEAGVDQEYYSQLQIRAEEPQWRGSVIFTGFLSERELANTLSAADAVVLPFRRGGGIWNTSIHAAVLQGSTVISTSREIYGLDDRRNLYFSAPDDVEDMKGALNLLAGRRRRFDPEIDRDEWRHIAEQHVALYAGTNPSAASDGGSFQ
jgi:glycosyltransferase involved in cell wall biosynthesis